MNLKNKLKELKFQDTTTNRGWSTQGTFPKEKFMSFMLRLHTSI